MLKTRKSQTVIFNQNLKIETNHNSIIVMVPVLTKSHIDQSGVEDTKLKTIKLQDNYL